MASSWWPFWPSGRGASISSPANFLHLSRTAIERIRELLLREEPLNPHQCLRMSLMLERTVRSIESMIGGLDDITLVCGSEALENFYRVAEKGKQLVENCCSADWCQASAFQIQNEEAFKQISLETSLCYNTIWKVVEDMRCEKEFLCEDLRDTSTFDPSSTDEVFKDRVALQDRLKGLVSDANISSCHIRSQCLGMYLLGRVKWALRWSTDEDFDVRSFNLWPDGNGPDGEWSGKSNLLGGNVCKTTWLDVPCAKKLFQDEMQEDEWLAEAKILASLNHPNIVKFLCCNKFETEHTRGHFIAMEHMDMSLGSYIKRLKEEGAKLSLISALDVILQIAHGMCYLHGHGIAHRDLKTSNVVVRKISPLELQYNLQAKIVDFGISKVKLQDKSNTMTRPKIGTTLYMPPEAFSNGKANWFKVDVYSFSVMCSVILSGNEPFQDIKRRDLGGAICGGRRPELPEDIPKELALVIKEGWSMDRNLRPGFVDICTRLEKLRHWLLRNHGSSALVLKQERFDSNLYIERMLKRRSEARERDRYPFQLNEEEEWFDGDEVPPFNVR
jgi:serine/threonine protein kinase